VEPGPIALAKAVDRMLRAVLADEAERPVLPSTAPEALQARLKLQLTPQGAPLDEVVDELVALAGATPRATTTHFFNQLFSGREISATAGEILAAVLNNSMYTYKAGGPHVLVERKLLEHMASIVGMEGAEGSFQAGGSLSNLVALLLARGEAFPAWRDEGPRDLRPVLYTSSESHYSISRSAGILGIGRANLRRIEVDERGRMAPEALIRQLEKDLGEGFHPFAINATAGTTVRGAFDPVAELAAIAREHHLWLHVDGAFGASVALSSRRRHLLNGVHQADSLSWDPHKMMGVPLPCSVLLVRRKGLLQKHLSENADYLFQEDDDRVNPGLRNIHCGRRNDALKLWAAWRYFGDEGWERRIEHQYSLARHAVETIQNHPRLRLVEDPSCITVCFEVEGADSAWICRRLSEEGLEAIGHGRVKGKTVIRLVTVNASLQTDDLDRLFENILRVADEAPVDADSAAR